MSSDHARRVFKVILIMSRAIEHNQVVQVRRSNTSGYDHGRIRSLCEKSLFSYCRFESVYHNLHCEKLGCRDNGVCFTKSIFFIQLCLQSFTCRASTENGGAILLTTDSDIRSFRHDVPTSTSRNCNAAFSATAPQRNNSHAQGGCVL